MHASSGVLKEFMVLVAKGGCLYCSLSLCALFSALFPLSALLFIWLCSDKHFTRPYRCFSKEIMAAEKETRVAKKKFTRKAKLACAASMAAVFMLFANAVRGPWRCRRPCPFALRLSSGLALHALPPSHSLNTPPRTTKPLATAP